MEKKRQIIRLLYACILCLCFSRTMAALTRMMGLPVQAYFLMMAALAAAALLTVYLPVRLLAGKLDVDTDRLMLRGKMNLTEWSIVVLLLGGLVCVRLFFAPSGIGTKGQFCYESARNLSAGISGLFSADLYIGFLRAGIGLFGETCAVFWCNLILQAAGCLLLFTGIRRLSGTIYAVMAVLSVICLSPFINSTYSAEPQSMFLLAAGLMLWICGYSMEWILRRPGNRWAMPVACGAGIFSGAAVFVNIRLLGFILLFLPGFFFLRKRKKAGLRFPVEYGCSALFGFFMLLLLTAFICGRGESLSHNISFLLEEWYRTLTGETAYIALLHSPTLTEYWRMVPVYLLAFFGLPTASDSISGRGMIWILPLAFFSLTDFVCHVPLQEQGMQFVIWGIMSGYGITGMLCPPRQEETGSVNSKKNAAAMPAVQAASAPAAPAPGEYLENPLPVPKRHIKKEMDYAFEPEPVQMYYEVPVADNDDFDV